MGFYPYPHRFPHQVKPHAHYIDQISKIKSTNDKLGFDGILLFTSIDDPIDNWVLASQVCKESKQVPLIATSPYLEHPFSLARKVRSLQEIYKRDIAINWITGLNISDHKKLKVELSKGERYEVLGNYINAVNSLLEGKTVTRKIWNYSLNNMRLNDSSEYSLRNFIAGASSELKITLEQNKNLKQIGIALNSQGSYSKEMQGIALGIITRENKADALKVFKDFIEEYEASKHFIKVSQLNSDSNWKSKLYDLIGKNEDEGYYASALKAYSQVPFFVGSYSMVKDYLQSHISNGRKNFFVSMISEIECIHLSNAMKSR